LSLFLYQCNFNQKGGGAPNPFTVSLMPFFRGRHLKSLFFCKLLQDISKKTVNIVYPIQINAKGRKSQVHCRHVVHFYYPKNINKERCNKILNILVISALQL
jgi:hypothetical protein